MGARALLHISLQAHVQLSLALDAEILKGRSFDVFGARLRALFCYIENLLR